MPRAEHEQKWKEGVHAHKRTERTYRVPVLHCDKGDKLHFRVLVRLGREAVAVSETHPPAPGSECHSGE